MPLQVAFRTHKNKQSVRKSSQPKFSDQALAASVVRKHQTKILAVSFFSLDHYGRPNRENIGRIHDIQSALGQTSYSAQDKPQSHEDVLNDSASVRVDQSCNRALK